MYSPTLEKYIFKGKRVKAISYRSQSQGEAKFKM